jgi:hypothetical protein
VAVRRDASFVHGVDYGHKLWVCPNYPECDCYGRVTLADAQLRSARRLAHQEFDLVWQNGVMTRSEAYAWLSEQLGIPRRHTHISQMTEAQCYKVVELVMDLRVRWYQDHDEQVRQLEDAGSGG